MCVQENLSDSPCIFFSAKRKTGIEEVRLRTTAPTIGAAYQGRAVPERHPVENPNPYQWHNLPNHTELAEWIANLIVGGLPGHDRMAALSTALAVIEETQNLLLERRSNLSGEQEKET